MRLRKRKLKKQGFSEEEIEDALRKEEKEAEKILEDKDRTQKLIDAVLKLCDKLSRLPIVGEVFRDLPLVCWMISDYVHGNYREVPLATIITLTAALAYFFSPINLISNIIPVVGWLDDALVFKLAFEAARNDLEAYVEWRTVSAEYYRED